MIKTFTLSKTSKKKLRFGDAIKINKDGTVSKALPKKYQPILKEIDPKWGYCIDDAFAKRVFDRLRKESDTMQDANIADAIKDLNKALENKLLAYVVAEFLTTYETDKSKRIRVLKEIFSQKKK